MGLMNRKVIRTVKRMDFPICLHACDSGVALRLPPPSKEVRFEQKLAKVRELGVRVISRSVNQ